MFDGLGVDRFHLGEVGTGILKSLAEAMPTRAEVWQRLVERHGLVPTAFGKLVGWGVGDFLFHHEADNITSTIKIRQAGFADALDTETRLLELFDRLVEQKVLPPLR